MKSATFKKSAPPPFDKVSATTNKPETAQVGALLKDEKSSFLNMQNETFGEISSILQCKKPQGKRIRLENFFPMWRQNNFAPQKTSQKAKN